MKQGPFKMKMKSYGQGKNPIQMGKPSPAKGLFGKIGGAIKGAITGKDGKFGLADAGRLALGPVGLAMGAARGMKMTEKASGKSAMKMKADKSPMKGYKSAAQRKAVHASKADGGAGNPNKMKMQKDSAAKFNAGLKKAAAAGKLDKNPKFKKAVMDAPAKMKKAAMKMKKDAAMKMKKTAMKMYGKKKQGKTLYQ